MHKTLGPATPIAPEIDFNDFMAVDIRAGTIVRAAEFPEARHPSLRLWIDFGPQIGERKSIARVTEHYTPGDLECRQILAVVNFPPRQIGPARSEVLVLSFADENDAIRLAKPDYAVPNGTRLT